jgi:hypothetical protein
LDPTFFYKNGYEKVLKYFVVGCLNYLSLTNWFLKGAPTGVDLMKKVTGFLLFSVVG